ncbi:glycosyltransferase family 39 protein [soil metagenome]
MNTLTKNNNFNASWFSDLLILTALFVCIFGFMLGSRYLGVPDEARYSEIPREMVATADYVVPRLNGIVYFEKPVLFYWMQAAAINMFGYNEWALRLPTALMALLGCLLTYLAGRTLYDRRTGFLASIILSTALLYFAMAHIITLDMTVSVLLTGALFTFLLGIRSQPGARRRNYLLAMYVFAALATLTKGLIGILFPGMIIGAWILLTQQWRLLKSVYLGTGALLFLAITLPWHILVQKAHPGFFDFYFIKQHFLRYFTLAENRYQPIWWFVPVTLLGFFPWVAFLFQAIKQSVPTGLKVLQNPLSVAATNSFLLLWVAIIFIFYSFSDSKLVPYILPIFPPMAILVARYLAINWGNLASRGLVIGFTIPAVISSITAVVLLCAPKFIETADVNKLYYCIAALIVTLLTTTYIPLLLIRRRNVNLDATFKFKAALSILAAGTVLSGWIANYGHEIFDDRSIQPLVKALKPLVQKNTEVVSYGHYYQDLPAYLQQRVTVAKQNHADNELSYGMTLVDTSAWMIGLDTFWQRWQGPQPMFMITNKKRYEKMLAEHRPALYVIARTQDDLLISNRPQIQ